MAQEQNEWLGPNPMAVMQISSAYWNSSVLHVAHSLDVFTYLAEKPATVIELAKKCKSSERGLEMILIACIDLGLLQKRGEVFYNSELADTFLVKGRPRYQGGIVAMFQEWVSAWANLKDAVVAGKPVVVKQHDKGEEATQAYIMGMLYRGIPQAELLAAEVPLNEYKSLLDVGGGPGIFSIIFCKRNPQLKATVLDLPQTLKVTRGIVANYKAEASVTLREGNYLEDTFGESYDVVLLSSMISQEGPDTIREILRKSFEAMIPGGKLLVQEQFLNKEKTGPLLPVLVGLNQLIHTPAGRAYSAQEVADIAHEVGFRDLSYRALPDPSPFTLITGIKP